MNHYYDDGWKNFAGLSESETENVRLAISPNVREIYAYWLARRKSAAVNTPFSNEQRQVGCNEPCLVAAVRNIKNAVCIDY